MPIQLTPALQQQVDELIATGHYPDAETVLATSLQLLTDEVKLAQLRALVQIGIDQADRGETEEYTPELRARIRASSRRRYAAGERAGPDVRP